MFGVEIYDVGKLTHPLEIIYGYNSGPIPKTVQAVSKLNM